MVSADQARHNKWPDAATVGPPGSPDQPNVGSGPVGTGRPRPASHRLPEPPPVTVPVGEQMRIERIPLTDVDPALGGVGGEGGQDYAVVLRMVSPAGSAGPGPAERSPVSITDTGSGYGNLTAEAGEPGADIDDSTGVVRSVN